MFVNLDKILEILFGEDLEFSLFGYGINGLLKEFSVGFFIETSSLEFSLN